MLRCEWARGPLLTPYHDEEWGVPRHDDRALFELLILEGAQAGLSWETVLRKRENYRDAFDYFNPEIIASYGENKVTELLANPGIIRNRRKVEAAIKKRSGLSRGARRIRKLRPIPLAVRQRPADQERVEAAWGCARPYARFGCHEQGPAKKGILLCRLDHLLLLHAGGGHGQRPYDRMLPVSRDRTDLRRDRQKVG